MPQDRRVPICLAWDTLAAHGQCFRWTTVSNSNPCFCVDISTIADKAQGKAASESKILALVFIEQLNKFAMDLRMPIRQFNAFARVAFNVVEFNWPFQAVADRLPFPASCGLKDFAHDAGIGIAQLLSEFPVQSPLGKGRRIVPQQRAN